ncbi:hypothetical protein IG631_05725 [Alternaria alternata]|nr:hypothetical protein IG631_05725 [Alternaria alternata]
MARRACFHDSSPDSCRSDRDSPRYTASSGSSSVDTYEGVLGIGGLAACMARERCSVRAPWPVPASSISNGGSVLGLTEGVST